MASRRQFLKVGAGAALALAVAQRLAAAPGPGAAGLRVLDEGSATIVAALIPVVLEGSLPIAADERRAASREVLEAFDRAVSGLSPAVRGEIEQLFTMLGFAPARLVLAGLWQPIPTCTPDEIAAFLGRWRVSRFAIQRAAYQALTQLILAAWLDNPRAWARLGYPGPPRLP